MEEKKVPFFSVIVASYNAGDKLRRTVQSVLSQTCGDYEIIVKDAGSSDGSVQELPQDARLRLIAGRDRGIYDGMNQGVAEAAGRYLLFLNCGDNLHDMQVLERVKEAAQTEERRAVAQPGGDGTRRMSEGKQYAEKAACGERDAGVKADGRADREADAPRFVFYGDIMEETSGQRVRANPVIDDFACYRNLPCHQACFYSRGLFAERGFDIALRVRADYEHFLWCYYRAGARMVYLDCVVADYEGGGFSETAENRAVSAAEHRMVTAMYLPWGKRALFRLYMIATLQPLREKIAHGRHTAALYNALKARVYGRGKA
ncbi:MAG: glycosyltransferase [Eubacteriales bacterium]|nr:glycosyltransferase [Eubacteriales bacterium]